MKTKLFAATSLALSLAASSLWAQAPSSSLKAQQPPGLSTPVPAPIEAPIAAPISPGASGFGRQGLFGPGNRAPKGKESDPAQRRSESVPLPAPPIGAAAAAVAVPATMGKKENMPSPRRAEIIAQPLKLRDQENVLAEQSRSPALSQMTPATGAPGRPERVGMDSRSTWRKASEPGILMVNRKARDFLVTPGGYLTIVGNAFGEKIGQVNLIGRFPGGKTALQAASWRDDEIYALLPEGLRGAPDHSAVLQVITRDGKAYRKDAARFVAAREEITLTTGIDRVLEFKPIGGWPTQMNADGQVSRVVRGQLQDCSRRTGTDRVKFKLPAGWQAAFIGMEHGRTDTGDRDQEGKPGSRAFFPRYAFSIWLPDDVVEIDWGIWRSRNAAVGGGGFLGDSCYSDYRLSVGLVGPAGVSPF